jgi:hypothetical protein
LRAKLYDKKMISMFPLWTFHLYVATFQHHLHMQCISLSSSYIPEIQDCWLVRKNMDVHEHDTISNIIVYVEWLTNS